MVALTDLCLPSAKITAGVVRKGYAVVVIKLLTITCDSECSEASRYDKGLESPFTCLPHQLWKDALSG